MNKAGAERSWDMIEQLDEPDVQGSWLEFPGRIKKYRNPSVIKEARASAAKSCAVVARGPLLRSRDCAVFIPRNRLARATTNACFDLASSDSSSIGSRGTSEPALKLLSSNYS
jgi:hypothetical protein